MKTTVEIPDNLLAEARKVAAREGTTLRALIEVGLRASLEARPKGKRFRLRVVTFRGDGLNPELAAGGWDQLRALVYEGRGA
jgi:hypothetical protein